MTKVLVTGMSGTGKSTVLDELARRPYGKNPSERDLILEHIAVVEPLLRRTATHEIATTSRLEDVADQLQSIGDSWPGN